MRAKREETKMPSIKEIVKIALIALVAAKVAKSIPVVKDYLA